MEVHSPMLRVPLVTRHALRRSKGTCILALNPLIPDGMLIRRKNGKGLSMILFKGRKSRFHYIKPMKIFDSLNESMKCE